MLIVALGTAVTSVLAAAPAAQAKPGRHVLNGSRPNWLGRAKAAGNAPAAFAYVAFLLYVRGGDELELAYAAPEVAEARLQLIELPRQVRVTV